MGTLDQLVNSLEGVSMASATLKDRIRQIHRVATLWEYQYHEFHRDVIGYIRMAGRDRQAISMKKTTIDLTDMTMSLIQDMDKGFYADIISNPNPAGVLRFDDKEVKAMVNFLDRTETDMHLVEAVSSGNGTKEQTLRFFLRMINIKDDGYMAEARDLARKILNRRSKMIDTDRNHDQNETSGDDKDGTSHATNAIRAPSYTDIQNKDTTKQTKRAIPSTTSVSVSEEFKRQHGYLPRTIKPLHHETRARLPTNEQFGSDEFTSRPSSGDSDKPLINHKSSSPRKRRRICSTRPGEESSYAASVSGTESLSERTSSIAPNSGKQFKMATLNAEVDEGNCSTDPSTHTSEDELQETFPPSGPANTVKRRTRKPVVQPWWEGAAFLGDTPQPEQSAGAERRISEAENIKPHLTTVQDYPDRSSSTVTSSRGFVERKASKTLFDEAMYNPGLSRSFQSTSSRPKSKDVYSLPSDSPVRDSHASTEIRASVPNHSRETGAATFPPAATKEVRKSRLIIHGPQALSTSSASLPQDIKSTPKGSKEFRIPKIPPLKFRALSSPVDADQSSNSKDKPATDQTTLGSEQAEEDSRTFPIKDLEFGGILTRKSARALDLTSFFIVLEQDRLFIFPADKGERQPSWNQNLSDGSIQYRDIRRFHFFEKVRAVYIQVDKYRYPLVIYFASRKDTNVLNVRTESDAQRFVTQLEIETGLKRSSRVS